MYKLLAILYIILISVGSVLLCMGGQNSELATQKRQQVDKKYHEQNNFLTRCVENLSLHEKQLLSAYKNKWSEEMVANLDHQSVIQAYKFVDCVKILSRHRAKKFLCPDFEDEFGGDDSIQPYVDEAYNRCIAEKDDEIRHNIIHRG